MTIHTEGPTPSPRPPPLQNHYAEDRVHHLFWSKLSKYFVLANLIRVRRIQQGHAYFPTLLLFFFLTPATAQQQQQAAFAKVRGDKTMAIVLLILVVLFFALGILSIYTRQCADRRLRGRLDLAILAAAGSIGSSSRRRRQQRGLDPAVVDSFPTFAYSAVKGALECAVCLSEFRDGETLRLIPDCCHVFHPDCIDVWLSTHSTCPVCRANLVPIPGDTSPSSPAINILDQNLVSRANDDDRNRVTLSTESQPRPERSASLDDESRSIRAFRRSNSTGHSPVRAGEDSERFTLRLPEGVRDRLVDAGSLSRTTSCSVTFERERSGRWGYRTRSMGRNERFEGTEGQLGWFGFSWTPPFVGRTGSNRSRKQANKAAASVAEVEVDVGERSCDLLFPSD